MGGGGYHRLVDDAWFVGRGGELERLLGLLAALEAGVGGAVLVEGEQGIGKTALLRAALAGAAAAGCRVLWGTGDELGQRFPLQLMAECIGDAGGTDGGEGLLSGGSGVPAGDPVLAGIERLLALVDRLCMVSPVVLVAEDLHWADEASVLVWQRLSRAVGQLPLLLAGSCRKGSGRADLAQLRRGLAARGASIIDLAPLPDAAVGDLVGQLAGGRPGRRLAEAVGRAGGNPLYMRELVDGLVRLGRVRVEAGVAELAGTSAPVRVPASLAAAIAGRLEWLPAEVVGVLRWAAVLGQEFSVTDLAVVTGRTAGELMTVVAAAAGAGVVTEAGPRLRFRHGLIRQVLYEGMPEALRSALHLQAAQALAAAGAAPERVAAQLVPGQGLRPDTDAVAAEPPAAWVVRWLADAAPALIYRAPQVAAELLQGVLAQLADDNPRRDGLEASLVTVSSLLLREDVVERVGGLLLARSADPGRAAEVAWLVAYTLSRTGRPAAAESVIGEALGRSGLSEAQTARLRALHGIVLTVAGQPDRAAEVAEAALASAERAGSGLAAGYALHALSNVSFIRRDNAGLLDYTGRGLEVIRADPQATDLRLMMLFNRAATLEDMDRQSEAQAAARQALAVAEHAGTPRLGEIRCFLAHHYFEAGQWDDALAELEPAAGLPGPVHLPLVIHGLFALIAGSRDQRNTAQEHLSAVRDPTIYLAARSNADYLLLAQALVAEQAGQAAEAAAVLAQCLQPGIAEEMPGRYQLLPTLARLAHAADDPATAAAAQEAAAAEAAREPLPVKTAAAEHCRGLVDGDPVPVLAAASYYERVGRLREQAQSLEDAAALAAARGDVPTARRGLAGAVRLYGGMGARWNIRRADSRLRSSGVRRGRGGDRARPVTGWEALTPTEVKVAYLVGNGQSNPDIAAEMFLSRNTVQTHVSHILAKLGARSRAEITREVLGRAPGAHSDTWPT
jgi:DNA-binding CsgD family transcriptional regulator